MQTKQIHEIKHLFANEMRTEWRNRYALYSIILLLLVSTFLVFTIDQDTTNRMWHAYFYLILIFGVVQNISRSFLGESHGTHLYYATLAHHRSLLWSKLLYQFFINTVFIVLLFFIMDFLLPQSIPHLWEYLVTVILFTFTNVVVFTFNSALSMSAKNSALISAVLSFPLLIPNLIVSLNCASKSLDTLENVVFLNDWLVMLGLMLITMVSSTVLFRFVKGE